MDQFLSGKYALSTWDDIKKGLPGLTKPAIWNRAQKLGLSRYMVGSIPLGKVAEGMATEAEIGWLAGALDGEGSIMFSRQVRTGRASQSEFMTPYVKIYNNDVGFIDKVRSLLGGGISKTKSYEKWNRPNECFIAYLSGRFQLKRVLSILLPHLTVKRERAEMVLRFIEIRESKPVRGLYGEEEFSIWRAFYGGKTKARKARPHLFEPGSSMLTPSQQPIVLAGV